MLEFRISGARPLRLAAASLPVAAALLALSSGAAHAQATLFTDRTSFLAALGAGATTTINFDNAITSGNTTFYNTAAGLTISGVNFVGTLSAGGNFLVAVRPAFNPVYQGWPGNPTVLQSPSGSGASSTAGTLTITLPAGVTAVGTDIYTVANGDGTANTVSPVSFTLSTGQTFSPGTLAKPNLAFAGFTSTVPITSITIKAPTGAATFPNLANFVFQSPAAAPEPISSALFLGGATLVAVLKRRRRTP